MRGRRHAEDVAIKRDQALRIGGRGAEDVDAGDRRAGWGGGCHGLLLVGCCFAVAYQAILDI